MEIYKQLNSISGQARSLQRLAQLLFSDNQLDAAKKSASQAISLFSAKGNQFEVCQCSCVLGEICCSKGETEIAINHFGAALGIASSFDWHDQQFWILHSLASLFFNQGRSDDAHAYIEYAKSHVANDAYLLGRAMRLQAGFWYHQNRLEEAKSEALDALGVFEKLGAVIYKEDCRKLLQKIDARIN